MAAVVLGMHRSGTSALAGVLAQTGFAAARTLLPSSAVNERGFWESEPVKALNDALLAEFGTTWHGLEPIRLDCLGKQRLRSIRDRIERVLGDEFSDGSRPLIKDPRLCRLLPLWTPCLSQHSGNTVYAITIRSPIEVAQSLIQRNEFDSDVGCLLWARYHLDAEFHTRGLPRSFVAYDRLIEDWRGARADVLSAAGTRLPLEPEAEEQVDEFLSAQLRHHRTADEQTFIDLEHLPIVQETYRIMLGWARGASPSEGDTAALDEAREQFDRLSGTLSRIAENARLDRKRLASAKAQGEGLSAELAQARKAIQDLDAVRASVESQAAAQARLEERIEATAASLSEAIRERSTLEQRLAETVRDAARERAAAEQKLSEAAAEAARQLAEAKREYALLETRLDKTAAAGKALQEQVDHLREEALQAAEVAENSLAALEADRNSISAELKDVKRKYRSTQHQLARDREKLRRTQEQVAELEADLEKIRQSRVWRTYTGLRSAGRRSMRLFQNVIGGGDRKRRTEQLALLRASSLFDRDWYLSRYPDVAEARIDPALHYLTNGWREGRDPSPSFATTEYLRANADVATAGINPLLHFLEFGSFEGRGISELSRPANAVSPLPQSEFGPAAPCFSRPVQQLEAIRWTRSARLEEHLCDAAKIRGQPIGRVANADDRDALERAFKRLAILSGGGAKIPAPEGLMPRGGRLADAWFASNGRLRSRWQVASEPLVVRAYQHLPGEGSQKMVGEGLVASSLDFMDAELTNPFFPMLFVLSDPDGTVREHEFLAFPSLCRGGLHYAELISLHGDASPSAEPIDLGTHSDRLAANLQAILAEAAEPSIARLIVDLTGADGTEALLQPEFQSWLAQVMRVSMEPLAANKEGISADYLAASAHMPEQTRRRGGALILPADTVPSIGALVASASAASSQDEAILPLLIAHSDPSQPAKRVEMPALSTPALHTAVEGFRAAWPRFVPDGRCAPAGVAAIRCGRTSGPNDAELLMPVAPDAATLASAQQAITWLLFPEDWEEDVLGQSLQLLALQDGADRSAVALVGEAPPSSLAPAQRLFGGRVSSSPDLTAALDTLGTPLTGYLGAHVLLHDARTSAVLGGILEDPGVVSASCVLISTEKRGKGWQVSIADTGTLVSGNDHDNSAAERNANAQLLWRSTYPSLRPPRDLWVGRSAAVPGWLQRAGPLRAQEGIHACTSLVTASYGRSPDDRPAHMAPPAAAAARALRVEALFG